MKAANLPTLDVTLGATLLIAAAQSAVMGLQGFDPTEPQPDVWLPLCLGFTCALAIFVTHPLAMQLVSKRRSLTSITVQAALRAAVVTLLIGAKAGLPYSGTVEAPEIASHAIAVLLAAILATVVLEWSVPPRARFVFVCCASICLALVQPHGTRAALEAVVIVAAIGGVAWAWSRFRPWLAPFIAAPVIAALALAMPSAGRLTDLVVAVAVVSAVTEVARARAGSTEPLAKGQVASEIAALAAIPMFGLATITGAVF